MEENKENDLVLDKKENILGIEYFKTLRTNIQFCLEADEDNSFVVTSSQPGEGKSFVVSNLASMFAIAGYKTVIVDLDLRRRTQHIKLGIENKEGMVNILTNKEFEDEKYIKNNIDKYINNTKIENLDVITAGMSGVTPPELLIKPRFNKIIEYLKKKYDYVILDTPPMNIISDTSIIAKNRKVVVVTSMNETKLPLLKDTLTTLEKINATVLGTVFNKVPYKNRGYYKSNKYDEYEYTYTYSTSLEKAKEKNKIALIDKKEVGIRALDIFASVATLPVTLILMMILVIVSKAKKMDKLFEEDVVISKNGEEKDAIKFCTTTTILKRNKQKHVVNDFGKFLEKSKLEYLPHVYNYIIGDLSLVKKYNVDEIEEDEEENKVIKL